MTPAIAPMVPLSSRMMLKWVAYYPIMAVSIADMFGVTDVIGTMVDSRYAKQYFPHYPTIECSNHPRLQHDLVPRYRWFLLSSR